MTLTVRRKRAIQLLLDQVNGSSLPLVQLPQQCGYSVRSSWKDLTLMAQYDACHIIREDDGYVLPLLWRGIPVKVSCPVSQSSREGEGPSSLCCSPNGMSVKLRGPSAIKNPHINVRGEWTPLGLLAEQCDYSLDRLAAETVIAVPFITCVQSLAPQRPHPVPAPPDKPVFPTPGFTYNADPYEYYYHPYYNYYLKYYAPEALRGVYNHLPRTSSESSAVQQPSHFTYQTSSLPSEPVYGTGNRLTFPYYYYYHYYLPQLFRYYQQLHHPGSEDSEKGSTSLLSPNLAHGELQWFPRASEWRHSSVPPSLSYAFNPVYFSYIAWHRSGVKEKLDDYARVAPPAPSSEDRKVPCMLHKLSSDPNIYVVPLDGCSVNNHMPGQNMGHQSDVQGILSDRGYFPVRLMVGCSCPLDSGEVRFQKMDPFPLHATEPPPSAVTVVLRIATDASFGSFYPKAHLPISLLQGKPVHVELTLLEPTEPTLVLVVHSCLAYTLTPNVYWMLFYDRYVTYLQTLNFLLYGVCVGWSLSDEADFCSMAAQQPHLGNPCSKL
ncbi:uncharacterized protein FYW61_016725 [Anableps anableps]